MPVFIGKASSLSLLATAKRTRREHLQCASTIAGQPFRINDEVDIAHLRRLKDREGHDFSRAVSREENDWLQPLRSVCSGSSADATSAILAAARGDRPPPL